MRIAHCVGMRLLPGAGGGMKTRATPCGVTSRTVRPWAVAAAPASEGTLSRADSSADPAAGAPVVGRAPGATAYLTTMRPAAPARNSAANTAARETWCRMSACPLLDDDPPFD